MPVPAICLLLAGFSFLPDASTKGLQHAKKANPPGAFIDQFGQNKSAAWPAKISSVSQLLKADEAEEKELAGAAKAVDRDEYQAWKGGPKLTATGYFRLDKVKGRSWLVAPSGNLFFSTGINCVGPGAFSPLTAKNKAAYSFLPDKKGEFAPAFSENGLSFYVANLLRKWKNDWRKKFDERALARTRYWGFTSFGNWLDKSLEHRYPYVSMGPPMWELKKSSYIDGDIADAYDPDFESEVFEICRKHLSKYKDDPYLIGYFVDNEMPWYNISYDVLMLDSKAAPCKRRWLELLKGKYKTIAALNKSWSSKAADFESLRWPGENANQSCLKDLQEFRSEFADKFYDSWYRGIKKADPNHLVLGTRIPNMMDEVVLASARHTDVLSFNHYEMQLGDAYDRYYQLTKKPILIGEYNFDSLDAGLLAAYVPVRNQKERAVAFSYYTENAAAKPYVVGCHYFQYIDEPLMGRGDGESSFNGFVNVCDIPYKELVAAARKSNAAIYEIHSGKKAPSRKQALP